MRVLLPLALAALLLASAHPAQAHIEGFSQARSLTIGPYLVYLQPAPDVIFANTTLTITAQVASNETGATVKNVSVTLLVGGPEGYNKRSEMREDRQGMLFAAFLLPARGMYSLRVLIKDAQGEYAGDTELEAYPDLPFRIRSADPDQDVYTGEPSTLRFEVVNRTTLRPADPFQALTLRLEHWNDDHTQLLGQEEAPLERDSTGAWTITRTFEGAGMRHMKFSSADGGFTYADVPILHLYATKRPADDPLVGGNEAPGAAPLLALLAAAALALLARRR